MRRSIFAVALLSLALGACAESGRKVEAPKQAVIAQLSIIPFNANVFYLAKQVPRSSIQLQKGADGVDWTFTVNGKNVCRFSAKVTEDGESASRVTTVVTPLTDKQETYLCDVTRIAGEETVAATLEKRAADIEGTRQQMAQYLIGNMGAATEMVSRRMEEMAPPKGGECTSGSPDEQTNCRKFMEMRAREMHAQGFDKN